MAVYHKVKQGEYLSKIAKQYGFLDHKPIWDHPENTELKQQRQNPNILFPGDRLFIPDKQAKTEAVATEQRHRFKIKGELPLLRIVLKDINDQPIANTACTLQVETTVHELTTNGKGLIEQSIPKTAEKGTLTFQDPQVLI